jgi:hypothetical protein
MSSLVTKNVIYDLLKHIVFIQIVVYFYRISLDNKAISMYSKCLIFLYSDLRKCIVLIST